MSVSKITYIYSSLFFFSFTTYICAQEVFDGISRGRELADSLCSVCHDVEKVPSGLTKTEIPSFVAIANRQGQTQEKIVGSLIFPHPEMPKVSFTNRDLKDLSNYIMSLKFKK